MDGVAHEGSVPSVVSRESGAPGLCVCVYMFVAEYLVFDRVNAVEYW